MRDIWVIDGSRKPSIGGRTFAQVGIKVQETPLHLDHALDRISTGDVAAVVVIGGPNRRTTNLHLLPIPAGRSVPDGMRKVVIPPGDRPDVTRCEAVETLAVAVHYKHASGAIGDVRPRPCRPRAPK